MHKRVIFQRKSTKIDTIQFRRHATKPSLEILISVSTFSRWCSTHLNHSLYSDHDNHHCLVLQNATQIITRQINDGQLHVIIRRSVLGNRDPHTIFDSFIVYPQNGATSAPRDITDGTERGELFRLRMVACMQRGSCCFLSRILSGGGFP